MADKLGNTDEDIEKLLKAIYHGIVTVYNLPKKLYFQTAERLKQGLYDGYGSPLTEFEFGTPDHVLLKELRGNIYRFSGAKTFTQVKEITSMMYDGKKVLTFADFKKRVLPVYENYNVNYLKAEHATALATAENSAKWRKIWDNRKKFPLLEYHAVGANSCKICLSFNGMIAPVEDPKWRKIMPPNHFFCYCTVLQHTKEDATITPEKEADQMYEKGSAHMQDAFKMNPGIDRVVFKEKGEGKHPYFKVEKKYRALALRNFGLPIPQRD
jgi:SPP1 gp7 family putative phage head morphogenesis protein